MDLLQKTDKVLQMKRQKKKITARKQEFDKRNESEVKPLIIQAEQNIGRRRG